MQNTNRKKTIEEIMANINTMRNKMNFKIMQQGHNYRVTHSQWCVLSIIEKNQDMGIKEISKILGITSSATTQLVDGLVESDYVERKTNTEDRRSLQLCLSKKGQKEIGEMKKKYTNSMKKLFTALNDNELNMYNNLHKKILTNINNV